MIVGPEFTETCARYKMAFPGQAWLLVCNFDVDMHLKYSAYCERGAPSITYACHNNEMAGKIFGCTLVRRMPERNLDG